MLYEKLLDESKQLDCRIASIQHQLNSLPPGKLIVTRNGSHYKWYVNDGRTTTYIPKSEEAYACELAKRKYLSLRLEEFIQEKKALASYLKHHSVKSDTAEQLFFHPDYARKVYSKLEQYNSHAIISSVNLITTFETKAHPLNADLIEKIVQYYFK